LCENLNILHPYKEKATKKTKTLAAREIPEMAQLCGDNFQIQVTDHNA